MRIPAPNGPIGERSVAFARASGWKFLGIIGAVSSAAISPKVMIEAIADDRRRMPLNQVVSNRVFYTLHRFFEAVHGPGDAAEVAALVAWCFLLISNLGTVAIVLIVATGNAPVLRSHILNVFVVAGIVIAITQYVRYLGDDRIDKLCSGFRRESASARTRRRWLSFVYSSLTVLMLGGSLWLLSVAA